MSAEDTLLDQRLTEQHVDRELAAEWLMLNAKAGTLTAIVPLALSVAQDLICELRDRHHWPHMDGASVRRYARDAKDAEALLTLLSPLVSLPEAEVPHGKEEEG
jgi:hypothetical protein